MPEPEHHNWLPVSAVFRPHAISVYWIEFGRKKPTEGFFSETTTALLDRRPPAAQKITSLEEMIDHAEGLPAAMPSGLIFHVSRCGSTLISRLLGARPGVVVLSEAPLLGNLLMPGILKGTPVQESAQDRTRRAALEAVIRIVAASVQDADPKIILKCHTISLLSIDAIRSLWPLVPALVLTRDPLEVLVSNHLHPAGWVNSRFVPIGESCIFGWSYDALKHMSEAEFISRGLGRLMTAAKRHIDDQYRSVDYEDLQLGSFERIAAHFNLPPLEEGFDIADVIERDAKVPSHPFEPDGARKRAAVTHDMRVAVEKWAQRPYAALREIASWKCGERS